MAAVEESSAYKKLKAGLHKVKVCKFDASETQKELEGTFFDNWSERCEVMEAKGIAIKDIKSFLDHMQEAYKGIDHETRAKMDGIKWAAEWSIQMVEFKYNKTGDSGADYGLVAFAKSKDKTEVDCMYVLYNLAFKVAIQDKLLKKDRSILWGLVKWQSTEKQTVERSVDVKDLKRVKNFFRVKALQGFYNEGLIDTINYVRTIEDIDDDVDAN